MKNYTNFSNKRTIKCKCNVCGSSKLLLNFNGNEKNIDPLKLTQKKAKKLVQKSLSSIWLCLGRCEDEADSVTVDIDGKKIKNPNDFIQYIADYGNPKLDDVDVSTTKKETDIITAVKIGDIETIKNYIDGGNNLDSYICDLPCNKKDDWGEANWTLLIYAIDERQYDAAIELINGGCDVNKPMKHINVTPLMCLLGNKYRSEKIIDVIDALMMHGADLSPVDSDGKDAFGMADIWGKKKHKQYIIDNYPEQYKLYLSKRQK